MKINNLLNKDVYSMQEIKTNKIWIDEKPIYRKIFTFNSLVNNSANIIGNIPDIETPITVKGFLKYENVMVFIPKPDNSNLEWSVSISVNISTKDVILTKGGFGTVTGQSFIIIEYTKTTD